MSKNVFDLAQEDTSLAVVTRRSTKGYGTEYAGPCPGCGGTDRFHVQPDRRDGGAWMCRNCRPAEIHGWGDNIEYLRQFRKMSFHAAKAYLAGEINTALERIQRVQRYQGLQIKPPSEQWQTEKQAIVDAAATLIWKRKGKQGLDYLLARGLNEDTIRKAQLGYALVAQGELLKPCIVIPWYADNQLYCVNMRDIREGISHKERYRALSGSSKAGLYQGDSLKLKRPTFIVEGEIDALTIAQAAGDMVAVVATGGIEQIVPKWIGRLARVPSVLVAYDREPKGEQKAKHWLGILEHNALRWCPIVKDVNAMLVSGYDVRAWVAAALDYLSEPVESPAQEVASELEQYTCSVCGINLTDVDTAAYSEDGIAYCNLDENSKAYCSRGTQPASDYERFLDIANRLAAAIGCEVTPVEQGYTVERHIAHVSVAERVPAHQQRVRHLGIPSWLQPENRDYKNPESRAAYFAGFTDVKGNHWNGQSYFQQRLIDAGERLGYRDLHAIYAIPATRDVIGYEAWLDFARNDTLGVSVQIAVKLAEQLLDAR